jgi:hypothetical protein
VSYLRDGIDAYDDDPGNTNFRWTRTYTGAELGRYVAAARDTDIGTVTAVEVSGAVGASGRIDRATVRLTGTRGAVSMTGSQFQSAVNRSVPAGRQLPSTLLFFRPVGALDAVAFTPDGLRVTGWTALRGSQQTALAHVSVDGRFVAGDAADRPRPDVARVVPGTGANTGFDLIVPATQATSTVCVYGVMANGATSALLGCREIAAPAKPFGALDAAVPVAGGLRVTGWAIDPATPGPATVTVAVDGKGIDVAARETRVDVARAYPGYGGEHGFAALVPATRGSHQVCVSTVTSPRGTASTRIACRQIKV